jgi:hypothetical protein
MEEPRRVAVIAASGLWRWKLSGGVAGDETQRFGSVFDGLARSAPTIEPPSRTSESCAPAIRCAGGEAPRPIRS